MKNFVNFEVLDLIKHYNFNIDLFFPSKIIWCLIIYIKYLGIWKIQTKQIVNYKVLDLVELYNFDMKFIFNRFCVKKVKIFHC